MGDRDPGSDVKDEKKGEMSMRKFARLKKENTSNPDRSTQQSTYLEASLEAKREADGVGST